MGLVRGAVGHYCLGRCSALVLCVQRSRPVGGVGAGAGFRVLPVSPFPPRISRAVCGGPSRPGVPYPRSLVRHSMRSVHSAGSVRLPFWYSPLVFCVCARSRSRSVGPLPLPGSMWRAHLARSRCWALVGPFHAVRAPLHVLPRSRAPFGLLVGGGRPVPVPPPLAWGSVPFLPAGFARCGASGVGRSPTPDGLSLGRAAGVHYPLAVGVGGVGMGTRHQPHKAHSSELALRAVEATRGRRSGQLVPGRGASWVRRSPTPDCLSFEACHWSPLPNGCGCGGCGRGDLSPNPQRALLRAGFACCGWQEGARGRGSCLAVETPRWGVLPPPTAIPSGRPARAHYPLALGVGCVGVGTHHQPHSAHSCQLALCAVGPRPGWTPLAWAWGVWGRALSNPGPLCFRACGWGPLPNGCGCGGYGRGELSPTHSARSCELALHAVGAALGRPAGASLAWVWGWALSHPRPLVLWGVRPRPITHSLTVGAEFRGVGADHQPHRARSCELALRAVGAARGPLGCGASGVGRSPTPDRSSLEACCQGPLPTSCRCESFGRGDPSPTPQRVFLRASFSCCGGGTRAPWVWGVRGRAVSHP